MRGLRRRLSYVVFHSDMSFVELMMSLCYLGWALVLLVAAPRLFSNSSAMSALSEKAPQWVWGTVFAITGLLKIMGVSLVVRWMRILGASLGVFLWVFVTVALWTNSVNTGLVVYAVFAGTCALTVMRQVRLLRDKDELLITTKE